MLFIGGCMRFPNIANNRLNYKSLSQKIRVLSEEWAENNLFCPICWGNLQKTQNNKPAHDFDCRLCDQEFELKTTSCPINNKILAGSYDAICSRIKNDKNLNLYIIQYDKKSFDIKNVIFVPSFFLTEDIIEKRSPLKETAKRAGWVGSYILLKQIPDIGKIFVIKDGNLIDKLKIISEWENISFVQKSEHHARGWIVDLINCINKIGKNVFSLNDVYSFESLLKEKHPNNHHIKEKIRQQLQFLRKKGYISFIKRGVYEKKL